VIAKTEQFLAVLKNPGVDKDAKTQALKFVIHFVGDMHQPLHVADNGDKGGSRTAPTSCGVWMRSFGVRQLAAAFLPASLFAAISTRAQIPASKLAQAKAAASCRTPKRAAPA
jgi:hypothetical protein